jgi:hypothetical protein
MRRAVNWGLSALLVISWILCAADVVTADRRGVKRIHENATLEKRGDDTLTFLVDRDGRMGWVTGRVFGRTKIEDAQGQAMEPETLDFGSVWRVTMMYPKYREAMPVIIGMELIRGKGPE